jgi:hypothetical protein
MRDDAYRYRHVNKGLTFGSRTRGVRARDEV